MLKIESYLQRYDMYCPICGEGGAFIDAGVDGDNIFYYECGNMACIKMDGAWPYVPPLDWNKTSIMLIKDFIERYERIIRRL